MFDVPTIKGVSPAQRTLGFLALVQEKFGKVGPVLSGDSGDSGDQSSLVLMVCGLN